MPGLQITARGDPPELSGSMPLTRALAMHLAQLPPGAPVVILVHGYTFSPFSTRLDPHCHNLSLQPRGRAKTLSWPRHLGFGRGKDHEGLCIAFGWEARGLFWSAYSEAERAGRALAGLLDRIGALTDRPVDILCHSLGARVALSGVANAGAARVGRVILLAAAELQGPAARCLLSPVGCRAEFINIISRENDLFDMMFEWLLRPFGRSRRALGDGLTSDADNWLDVQIDHDESRQALAALGHRIPAPTRRICHWSGYLRPGMLTFHSALIRDRDSLPLALLRATLPADRDPRWSRFIRPSRRPALLPFARKAAS